MNNKVLTHFTTEPVEIYLPSIITSTILLIIISMIGTIGNSLVVWAFTKQVKQGIISGLFILLLACNDLFICLIVIPCTLYLDIWTGDTTDWICRAHLTMKGFVVPVSACILMLIAMERFLLICFIPGIQMQRTHIVLSLVIIFCIGLLCAIPMGLHAMTAEMNVYESQITEYKIEIEHLNRELQNVKKTYFKQKRRQQQMNTSSNDDDNNNDNCTNQGNKLRKYQPPCLYNQVLYRFKDEIEKTNNKINHK
uniref:Coiled-coil domain-containing protein 147 n=1 Tax=Schistosoma haematobium TaxID=6185 RepID=A0A095CBI3_SCHHA